MNRLRDLSDNCAAALHDLAEAGITIEPAEVIKLNGLCWDVESPEMELRLSRGMPVNAGGVWLWPLTLRGHVWYTDIGDHMPTHRLRSLALAYAMAHGYDGELDRPEAWEARSAESIVRRWWRTLRCRMRTLEAAIAIVIEQEDAPDVPKVAADDGPKLGPGEYAAFVAARTGRPIQEIEGGMSLRFLGAIIDKLIAQEAAEGGVRNYHPQRELDALNERTAYIKHLRSKYAKPEAGE